MQKAEYQTLITKCFGILLLFFAYT